MFDQLKLSTRLAAGFGALLLLLTAVVGMAAWQMRHLAAGTQDFATNIVPSLQEQYTMSQSLATMRRLELRHLLTDELKEMETSEAAIVQAQQTLKAALNHYVAELLADAEDRRLGEESRRAVDVYFASWEKLREVSRKTASKDPAAEAAAKAQLNLGLKDYLAAQKALDDWWAYNMTLSENARKNSEAGYATGKTAMGALSLVAMLLGIAAAMAITRSVQRQLGGEPAYAKQVVGEIAQGNLAVDVQLRAGDSESLLAAMRGMRDRLAEVVTQVRASSDSIATGSSQIATGNADLSQRTEEQASNLQQTAASMEQLSGTVKTSADTASEANRLASDASQAAARGGELVGQVVATMQDISASSRKIGDIIGTIDGIAFQTNILALNAAVEAARAGEQGRGFAVVAGEVRTLAQRSAEAAREIKALIGASLEKVEAGARQVDDAGHSMGEIVTQVQRVGQMIGELSGAAIEQSAGIGQVNDAMTQLDQVTQQNAALVEESAAAAESLRQQADRLAQAVSVFRVSGAAAGMSRAPSAAAAAAPRPVVKPAAKPAAKPAPARPARAAAAPAPARSDSAPAVAVTAPDDDWSSF